MIKSKEDLDIVRISMGILYEVAKRQPETEDERQVIDEGFIILMP